MDNAVMESRALAEQYDTHTRPWVLEDFWCAESDDSRADESVISPNRSGLVGSTFVSKLKINNKVFIW